MPPEAGEREIPTAAGIIVEDDDDDDDDNDEEAIVGEPPDIPLFCLMGLVFGLSGKPWCEADVRRIGTEEEL